MKGMNRQKYRLFQSGAGLRGAAVSMWGEIGWYDSYGQFQASTNYTSGYTDSNGNLYLYVEFILEEEYNYPVQYTWMSVWLSNGVPAGYFLVEQTDAYGYGDTR